MSDQGALVSVNGGESWSSWYNQPTAQLYHVAATNTFPYQVCAGQQESGSVCTSTRGNDGEITFRDWHPAGIIEYGYAAPDPLHPEIVYGAGRTEVSRYNRITGEVQNVTPLPMRKRGFRADRTRADSVFARRSAHAVLRGEPSFQDDGLRAYLGDDQSRSEPGEDGPAGVAAGTDCRSSRTSGAA